MPVQLSPGPCRRCDAAHISFRDRRLCRFGGSGVTNSTAYKGMGWAGSRHRERELSDPPAIGGADSDGALLHNSKERPMSMASVTLILTRTPVHEFVYSSRGNVEADTMTDEARARF